MVTKILLVEDDANLGMVLQESLILKGSFKVTLCKDGEEGLKSFLKSEYDLCILDVMMPKKDGFTLAKEIRRHNPDVPIIFATAKGMLEDKKEGFASGGDDYITKPFNIDELIMRINALLKRSSKRFNQEEDRKTFVIGKYKFDFDQQLLVSESSQQKMTTKEAELLRLLCLNTNHVLKREEALLSIWHDDSYFNGRSMDVFLTKLRKYLKDDPNVEIVNIHGKGYKLVIAGNKAV